jgi:hypothetical protein
MKNNKYAYYVVLQGNYGFGGFDDLDFFETPSDYYLTREQRKELKHLKNEYSLAHSVSLRTVKRRELNN